MPEGLVKRAEGMPEVKAGQAIGGCEADSGSLPKGTSRVGYALDPGTSGTSGFMGMPCCQRGHVLARSPRGSCGPRPDVAPGLGAEAGFGTRARARARAEEGEALQTHVS